VVNVKHPPSRTAQEQLHHQITLAKGSSPFYPDETPRSTPDTSVQARCSECGKHFVGTAAGKASGESLLAHLERDHAPKPQPTRAADIEREQAVELVRTTLAGRIASAELQAGQVLSIAGLAEELGTTRTRVEAAVSALVKAGRLGFLGVGSARRCVVVG
jgi:hypothetical protein